MKKVSIVELTAQHCLSLLVFYELVHIICKTAAVLFQFIHTITHYTQSFCSLLDLPLHISPISFLATLSHWLRCTGTDVAARGLTLLLFQSHLFKHTL